MASLARPALRLALLCGILSAVRLSHGLPEDQALEASLGVDDLCAASAEAPGCALSALQLHGRGLVEEATAGNPAPRDEATLSSAGARRRRRHGSRSAHDITAAEEERFHREINGTRVDLANVSKALAGIEAYENETRWMVTKGPVAKSSHRRRSAKELWATGRRGGHQPRQQGELLPGAAHRRRSGIGRRAIRIRRVVKALDALQDTVVSFRQRIAVCDRLDEWTNARIDNPNTQDFDAGGGSGGAEQAADQPGNAEGGEERPAARALAEPLVTSKKHLEEQLAALKREIEGVRGDIDELQHNAKHTRSYYLQQMVAGSAAVHRR